MNQTSHTQNAYNSKKMTDEQIKSIEAIVRSAVSDGVDEGWKKWEPKFDEAFDRINERLDSIHKSFDLVNAKLDAINNKIVAQAAIINAANKCGKKTTNLKNRL